VNDLRKAAEMALERLESHEYWMDEEAINALRQALANQTLDDLAAESQRLGLYEATPEWDAVDKFHEGKLRKREWVGLVEQDVHDAFQFTELIKQLSWERERPEWCENFAAYIETKLKEKNT
jgi:hypothetical protein